MSSVTLVLILKILAIAGSALTAAKLLQTGLFRRYPIFFAYVIFRVPNGIWTFFLNSKSNTYLLWWVITECVLWVFYVLLVFELYRLVVENYKGIYTVGRRYMYVGVVVSGFLSALSLIPTVNPAQKQRSRILPLILGAERGLDLSLAITILLILAFMVIFRVPLGRNVRIHAAVFTIYFLSNTMVFLLRFVFGLRMADQVDLMLMATSCGCLYAWLFLLSPQGESGRVESPVRAGDEQKILIHLDALNQTLLRASKQVPNAN